MRVFEVVLEVRHRGNAAGSTSDLIEAATAVDAEAQAIAAWREVRPDRTFHPLLTIDRTQDRLDRFVQPIEAIHRTEAT